MQGVYGLGSLCSFFEKRHQLAGLLHLTLLINLSRCGHQETTDTTQTVSESPFLDLPNRNIGNNSGEKRIEQDKTGKGHGNDTDLYPGGLVASPIKGEMVALEVPDHD